MKKTILHNVGIVILMCIGGFQLSAQPEAPTGKKWEVVSALTDEFNTWDGTKWYKEMWDYGNTPVHMVKENAYVENGNLIIAATKNPDETSAQWMLSSRVASRGYRVKYPMYTECKMKANSISSYSTYWLNNGNESGRDEVDMCESNANPSWPGKEDMAYTLHSQYFIVENNVTERNNGNWDNHQLSEDNPLRGVHWDEAYHTIGVWLIDAHNVQFYLNGEKAGKVTSIKPFTLQMRIIWDVWTQNAAWVGGLPQPEELLDETKNKMYVDWVHTYDLVDDPTNDVEEEVASELKLYPNPAQNSVNVELPSEPVAGAQLKIYSTTGSVVKSIDILQTSINFSVDDLPEGYYVIQVINGDDTFIQRLVK